MRILMIHNRYRYRGGEDVVFESEANLLREYGHVVREFVVDNSDIASIWDRVKAGLGCVYNFEYAKLVSNIINTFGPDVVHVHNFFPIISPSVFYVSRKLGVPVVLTLHNYRLVCPKGTLFRGGKVCEKCLHMKFPVFSLIGRCYRNSLFETFPVATMIVVHNLLGTWRKMVDRFIVLTCFQKDIYLSSSLCIASEKFRVKPNFTRDMGEGVSPEDRENFFLYVGRLSEEKGIETLVRAVERVGVSLKVAGDGPLRGSVEKVAGIEYLGLLSRLEVIKLMKKAKALLFPSECYECFPMVVLEALSTGTPVIASDVGGPASIVKDGVTGFLFRAGSEDSLAKVLADFSSGGYNYMYGNARKAYLEGYTPEKNYRQLMNIYKEVIDVRKKEGHMY